MRIWLNHWFSTAYRLIENARTTLEMAFPDEKVQFIGTNTLATCVYASVCDEFYLETTDLSEEGYIKWCIEFCKLHGIDVFVPRRHRVAISEHSDLFKEIGVKVLVSERADWMRLFDNKIDTYSVIDFLPIPKYACVNTCEEFKQVYKELKKPDNRVCFKYGIDEGAVSFRVVDDHISDISVLKKGRGSKLTYEETVWLLGTVNRFDDMLVMPYLEGPELSIDCLQTKQGLIAIPRMKEGRVTRIFFEDKPLEMAKQFAEKYKMSVPYNLQFRWHKGVLYLLEVNTRLSGGAHIAYEVGVDFLGLAIEQLIKGRIDTKVNISKKDVLISQIETPVVLNATCK